MRGDLFWFNVNSDNPSNTGDEVAGIARPKIMAVLGPWNETEFYLNNGQVGWRTKQWELALECLNIFNRADNDIEYFYASRHRGEPLEGIEDVVLHPTEPRMFRVWAT